MEFQPSHPGGVIQDILRDKQHSPAWLAWNLGSSTQFTRDLIAGIEPIDHSLAVALSRILGGSTQFWLQLEEEYRKEILAKENP